LEEFIMKAIGLFTGLLFILPVTGNAFPMFDSAVVGKLGLTKTLRVENCTDFTGSWKGSCTTGDAAPVDSQVNIKQYGCAAMTVGEDFIPLEGLKSHTVTLPVDSKNVAFGFTSTSNWDTTHTLLKSTYGGSVQADGHAIQISGEGLMRIDGNKLSVGGSIFGIQVSCVYDKQ
jgi:hypothetical protein